MSDDHGLVIPTAGHRDHLLDAILEAAGLPADHVVITTNSPGYSRGDCTLVRDHGPLNIHRWWNLGIDVLERLGLRYATVLNDDVTITPDSLPAMRRALRTTGATLAHPGPAGSLAGHAWTLDLTHGIRPDQTYRWWYGDDQLHHDAKHHGHGAIAIPELVIPNTHHAESTWASPELQALAEQDRQTWDSRRSPA